MKECRLVCDSCGANTDSVTIPIVSKKAQKYLKEKRGYEEICDYCFSDLSKEEKSKIKIVDYGDIFIITDDEKIEDLKYKEDFALGNRD